MSTGVGNFPPISDLGYTNRLLNAMDDEDEDPYESLPGVARKNTLTYMTAGAAAGVLEHCVMYPIDVVRTRMQSVKPQIAHQSFCSTVAELFKTERFRTFRGMPAVMAGAIPAHALYFSCYENMKQTILRRDYREPPSNSSLSINLTHINTKQRPYLHNYTQSQRVFAHGIAGCGATLVHDAIMNPVEVIKQRMQMYKSPFESSYSCFRHILRSEGLGAFYRSYSTQLTLNLPFQALHFVTYEFMQDLTNASREYNPKAHVISGAVAGAIASASTTPLDVCKTLLNTQEKLALVAVKSERIIGLLNAIKAIYRCCGMRGYFQGLQARVIVAMPSTAISWTVYEFFKYYSSNRVG